MRNDFPEGTASVVLAVIAAADKAGAMMGDLLPLACVLAPCGLFIYLTLDAFL